MLRSSHRLSLMVHICCWICDHVRNRVLQKCNKLFATPMTCSIFLFHVFRCCTLVFYTSSKFCLQIHTFAIMSEEARVDFAGWICATMGMSPPHNDSVKPLQTAVQRNHPSLSHRLKSEMKEKGNCAPIFIYQCSKDLLCSCAHVEREESHLCELFEM